MIWSVSFYWHMLMRHNIGIILFIVVIQDVDHRLRVEILRWWCFVWCFGDFVSFFSHVKRQIRISRNIYVSVIIINDFSTFMSFVFCCILLWSACVASLWVWQIYILQQNKYLIVVFCSFSRYMYTVNCSSIFSAIFLVSLSFLDSSYLLFPFTNYLGCHVLHEFLVLLRCHHASSSQFPCFRFHHDFCA